MVRESKWIKVKKNQNKEVVKVNQKAKKWLNLKSRSEQKKQRTLKLKTLLANQDCFLLLMLIDPLLN